MATVNHIPVETIEKQPTMPSAIWIVSGVAGLTRTKVAEALLASFEQSAHIDGDALGKAIVSGQVASNEEPKQEADRQIELSMRNQCLLARSYAEAGFTPVVEYAVQTRYQLDAYRNYLAGGQIRLVVALRDDESSPTAEIIRSELNTFGVWVTDADHDSIIANESAASIS